MSAELKKRCYPVALLVSHMIPPDIRIKYYVHPNKENKKQNSRADNAANDDDNRNSPYVRLANESQRDQDKQRNKYFVHQEYGFKIGRKVRL